jgi:hypothetical protein
MRSDDRGIAPAHSAELFARSFAKGGLVITAANGFADLEKGCVNIVGMTYAGMTYAGMTYAGMTYAEMGKGYARQKKPVPKPCRHGQGRIGQTGQVMPAM